MDNKCSHSHPRKIVNLKQLPPIDPFRIMNSSSSSFSKVICNSILLSLSSIFIFFWQLGIRNFGSFFFCVEILSLLGLVGVIVLGKLNNSSTRAAAKVVKPSPNLEMSLVDSDEAPRKTNSASVLETPTLGLGNVDDVSSISSNKKSETCGNTTWRTDSGDDGMKKGSARSNLYEICAANHWKPPIFECYKEEGPCHQRMFTFKVIIETEAESKNIIECYGAPGQKKKAAADQAAEGALWYLKHTGYVMKNQ